MIYVDVDGTLIRNGQLNKDLIRWILRMKTEYSVHLWSMRGESYCETVCQRFGIRDLFDKIMSKPGIIVDDSGWSWITQTRIIKIHGT